MKLLAAVVVVAGCGLPDTEYFGQVPEVVDPGHLRYCNSGEPEGLDPATTSSTTAMKPVYLLFDGLTDYDQNGLPEPSLATHWEVSDDVRTFTFHLHDRGRWSNGRPITAWDVRYQIMRVLHPSTASINADGLSELKNATLYNGNAVRIVQRDVAGLHAGDVLEVTAVAGRPLADWRAAGEAWPDSNTRRGSKTLALRDRGAEVKDAYARVPAGADVLVLERTDGWGYVYWNRGDGVYGWVPWDELDVEPNADVSYTVGGVEVAARELLMLPEAIGVRVPDDHTIVFETTNPTPWFVSLTNNRALRPTPREAVSRDPRRWTDVGKIVTSGPMNLVSWKQRDAMELVRSPTYWNQDEVKLDRITILAVDDQAAAANLYFTGACDALTANHLPASYTRPLSEKYKDFHVEPWLGVYFAMLQTEKFPNRHFRRALAYAIDRTQIPKFLHGGQFPTAQYMPGTPIAQLTDDELALCGVTRDTPGVVSIMITGELCYVPPPGLDFDPAKAKEELALARQEGGAPSSFVYKFNQGSETHKLVAEYLQAQWQRVLGLDVELEIQEWKTFLSDTKGGQFEAARFGWIGNFPDAEGEFLPMFRCDSPNNRPHWCDAEYERLMTEAKPIRDREARLVKVRAAEARMIEDAPIIPLFVYTQVHMQKPYVKDLYINLIDQPPLHEAWLDPDWRNH